MPQVKGLYERHMGIDPKEYCTIKIIDEINELKNCPYELVYNYIGKAYMLLFELDDKLYSVISPNYLISIDGKCDLYGYDNGIFSYCEEGSLGEDIQALSLKLINIIKNNSNERIKYLLNK